MSNREAAIRIGRILLNKVDPSGKSAKEWVAMVEALSDKEFENYIEQIEAGKAFVPLIYENLTGSGITTAHLQKVGKELGVEFYQRIATTDPITGALMKPPIKFPVLHLPVRRPVQMLREKWSIPKGSLHTDELTGQVTGESKSSAISLAETLILNAQGQDMALQEFLHLRGGDDEARATMERRIAETGEVDATDIVERGTKTKASRTLSVMLRSQHFDNTL